MSEPETKPQHVSMIRGFHLADLFTLAAALIPLALVFDALDGRGATR